LIHQTITTNQIDMKARKFENVEVDQIVSFEEKGMIETGVVCEVKENTFTLRALRMWDDNGVKSFYERYFSFLKTGTKSHSHYTHGNAIQITGRI
jgi:hypothetical protein